MSAGRPPGDGHQIAAVRLVAAAGLTGLAIAACGHGPANPVGSGAASSPAAVSTGSTRQAPGEDGSRRPVAPLTGLPAASTADAARPAVGLAVAGSSPQGLGLADVVFEEISKPVRYIAVYQSRAAFSAGPITSTRPADGRLLSVIHPLFGYDGGSGASVRVLDNTKVTDLGALRYPSLYTSTPQGMTASAQAMLTAAKDGAPPPLFSYRSTGASGGDRLATTGMWHASSVQLTIPGAGTQDWAYDPHTGRWSASGGPAAQVANLVIQTVAYKAAFLDKRQGITAPAAQVIGTGNVEVFSAGMAATGTWAKRSLANVTNYFAQNGSPMELEPGPTWVILAPQGTQAKTMPGRS